MSSSGSSKRTGDPQSYLYVGNLGPNATEAELLEKFSAVGAIRSVKVIRSQKSHKRWGCGFVHFRRAEDAARALESMNSTVICGRPVRVMWARLGSPPPEVGFGVLVKGLNADIDSDALRGTFSTFGSVIECKVISKGHGFVQFGSEESIAKCIEMAAGWRLTGLSVTKLFTNVQVRNFGNRLNSGTLRFMFEQYGEIDEYRVVSSSGASHGFAYVTFKKLESAARAVVELDGKEFDGGVKFSVESAAQPEHSLVEKKKTRNNDKPTKAKEVRPKHSDAPTEIGFNLYVVVMDGSISNERLRSLFSPFGTIKSVKVLIGKGQKRAGFVRFATKEQAARALNEMNGKIVGEAPLSVTHAIVKESTSDNDEKPKKHDQEQKQTPIPEQTLATSISKGKLYQKVKMLNATLAGMITVKLLELDNAQLVPLMANLAALRAKVEETVVVLLLGHQQQLREIERAPAGTAAA